MSRTDKDRPYRVIMNDRTLGRVEHHDHCRPRRYYSRYVTRGERMLVPYGEHTWILRHPHETPGMTPQEHAESQYSIPSYYYMRAVLSGETRPTTANLRWYYERPQRYEWVGRVEREVEISEGCTIDQPYIDRYSQNCWVEPPYHAIPWGAFGRSAWDYWDDNRGKDNRRSVRDNTKRYVKEYNTFSEVDDSTWL